MDVIFYDADNVDVINSFRLFLTHVKAINSKEILLFSPTKTNSLQIEWIKSTLGKNHFDKLMSAEAKISYSNFTIHYRSSATLKKRRIYAQNLTIMCYYPDDKEIDQLRELKPSILFIYGKLAHIPETAMDYELGGN